MKDINSILQNIRLLAADLPAGARNTIVNRCDKIAVAHRRGRAYKENTDGEMTQKQIADRYIAKKAILDAMIAGREVSFLDSKEFKVSEMHTQMCVIRQDIERKALPYTLSSRWITFGEEGKRCKAYRIIHHEI